MDVEDASSRGEYKENDRKERKKEVVQLMGEIQDEKPESEKEGKKENGGEKTFRKLPCTAVKNNHEIWGLYLRIRRIDGIEYEESALCKASVCLNSIQCAMPPCPQASSQRRSPLAFFPFSAVSYQSRW